MDLLRKSVVNAFAALAVIVLFGCTSDSGEGNSPAEHTATPATQQLPTIEHWSDKACGDAVIYDDNTAGLGVGVEADGSPCSLRDSVASLLELPQEQLDRVRILGIHGDIDLGSLPPFLKPLTNLEELEFVSLRVEGDPQLTDDNEIFNLSFRNTEYADLSEFTPMPNLTRLTAAVATVESGEVILPEDIGTVWPSLRAISDVLALIVNLDEINSANEPLTLFFGSGHPQLPLLEGPLERVVIVDPEGARRYSETLDRLRERGVAIDIGPL